MLRKVILFCFAFPVIMSLIFVYDAPATAAQLTAEQIVNKNIAARGGPQAWQAVQTMSYAGKMDAGGKQNVQLPFLLELKRPRGMRLEIEFAHDTAIQVYDGVNGWKLRPYLNRRDVEPFTPEELKSASMESALDGPLVDYANKGTKVELVGVEKVEGHDAYKLKLTMNNGQARNLWVDAETFLELKIEGPPHRMNGKMRPVEIYYRQYQTVSGLAIPFVLETAVQGYNPTHKMIIDRVVVNPKLEDSLFVKPTAGSRPPVKPA